MAVSSCSRTRRKAASEGYHYILFYSIIYCRSMQSILSGFLNFFRRKARKRRMYRVSVTNPSPAAYSGKRKPTPVRRRRPGPRDGRFSLDGERRGRPERPERGERGREARGRTGSRGGEAGRAERRKTVPAARSGMAGGRGTRNALAGCGDRTAAFGGRVGGRSGLRP